MDPISASALKILVAGLTAKTVVDKMLDIRQKSTQPAPTAPKNN